MEDFGTWLARQLARQRMSQTEMADKLGVTRAAVSAWVNGRAEPRWEKVHAIGEILGIDTRSVLTLVEPPMSADQLSWRHRPAHPDGGRELGNAAAFAFDADLGVVAREATQNSLDERFVASEPVKVQYTLNELTGPHLQEFLAALRWKELESHFEAVVAEPQKVGRVLADGLRELRERRSLVLLKIDDYNAAGLTGPEYDDGRFSRVVRRQLDSGKAGPAGGSYGIGKATLWAASRFGLVLINSTLSVPFEGRRGPRVIGRLDLPWRRVSNEQYAGPAWFGAHDPDRAGAARSWWADDNTISALRLGRQDTAPGTSFLIVGAHDASGEATGIEGMHRILVESLASHFWASMVSTPNNGPLLEASVTTLRNDTVVVSEERIDPDTHQPARSRALRAYLTGSTVDQLTSLDDVVKATVPLTVPPLKRATNGRPVHHEAVLLLAVTDDDRPNRLVCMRSSRMAIIERSISDIPLGSPHFQAVLLAGGATGSDSPDAVAAESFLRTSEPPEHNNWKKTDDLTATYARGAISRLKEFQDAALNEIRRILRRPHDEISDDGPAALRDLLNYDAPSPPRSPGFPTVKSVTGSVDPTGAWRIRVEVRLPEREDPWLLTPTLRFATRSGPKPEARWSALTPEAGCEVTEQGNLVFAAGIRSAAFSGVSDVQSHPVAAQMAIVEVDLKRVKGTTV
ncbi:helix-turn-helix domain-containing protein [Nocardia arthritidis]|uniref:Helix-turn-helix domain-containing protein n=1 Tax=Nocardia arthritidis TaxID=228602 RepID=A0A6G9YN49_9NOCA|nr:helix-turn-helix transcriptional regulator [Nocardia arthritidis]QIS14719.1 helix-turn-helix domain-containing protein [Nocardia arthritidis]